MKCPIDTAVDLVMTERSGIEIDYCPTCRGVWLDRGELDKIIERSASTVAPTPPAPPVSHVATAPVAPVAPVTGFPPSAPSPVPAQPIRRWDDDDDDDRRERSSDPYDKRYKKKRRGSFLEEIFDF